MIIQSNPETGLTLILQTEHSQFVGRLAAHWGNSTFAAPQPFESVVRAATFHDFGYQNWEPDLPFDAASGRPLEFRQLKTEERQLAAYQWCVDWVTGIDPYAGLLMGMHRTGLWRGRYGAIAHPPAHVPGTLSDAISSYIAHNEALQSEAKLSVDQACLAVNYQLLQVWDLLGLYFGCAEPYEHFMEPVPAGYAPDSALLRVNMRPLAGGKVEFDPYPFDVRPFKVQMICRRLPQTTFADQATFRKMYAQAPLDLLEYEVV